MKCAFTVLAILSLLAESFIFSSSRTNHKSALFLKKEVGPNLGRSVLGLCKRQLIPAFSSFLMQIFKATSQKDSLQRDGRSSSLKKNMNVRRRRNTSNLGH